MPAEIKTAEDFEREFTALGWQPMATAPRDGTICDLWLTGGGRLTDQWWCGEDGTWCGLEEEMFSHWMRAPYPQDYQAPILDDE